MDKLAEIAQLLDIYGGLLTEKQQDIMDLYFNHDLSLQEIAELEGITRQGVHDLIKRGVGVLNKTEEKLGFRTRLKNMETVLESICLQLEKSKNQSNSAELDCILNEIKNLAEYVYRGLEHGI